ncbi:MAG: YtxH domain-containing protein [Anaerolineales bacterium]
MDDYDDENEHDGNNFDTAKGFLAGILMGGLVGTAATLLLAPQSGKKTRSKIRHAGLELRDQAVSGVEDVMDQARASGRHLSAGMHKQAAELQERGQAIVDEQKERVATLVEAGKKVAKGSSN